jgi:hypothetical protein
VDGVPDNRGDETPPIRIRRIWELHAGQVISLWQHVE